MKTRLILTLLVLVLTFSASAQIDPPIDPVCGFLPLYPLTGSIALRESPASGAPVLLMLSQGDVVEPINEQTTVGGVKWAKLCSGGLTGWVKTERANGTKITMAFALP